MLTLVSLALFILSSAFLVWFFLKNDHGEKEPKGALLAAAGFGVLAVAAALWVELLFLPDPLRTGGFSVLAILIPSLLIGFTEELSKFGPLALFIWKKPYFNEHTDGVIYFGIAGLTFGFLENVGYLLFSSSSLGGTELTGILRLVILFFFHAASTGIAGYYLAKAKIQHQSLAKPFTALAILAVVHGLYDFFFLYAAISYRNYYLIGDENTAAIVTIALVSGLIISALLNTFLFLYYRRARQWDASVGLSSEADLKRGNYPQAAPPQPPAPAAPAGPGIPAPYQ